MKWGSAAVCESTLARPTLVACMAECSKEAALVRAPKPRRRHAPPVAGSPHSVLCSILNIIHKFLDRARADRREWRERGGTAPWKTTGFRHA